MRAERRTWLKISALSFIILVSFLAIPVLAQEGANKLIVTGSDASSPPAIEIQLYALDDQNNVVSLKPEDLVIQHGGEVVDNIELVGTIPVGTLAIFVIDIPSGVSSQIATIQDAITRYASDANMVEQVDFVAVFRVDELAASQILPPSDFYNTILNAFANPLDPTSGNTALIDSLMGIVNNIESVKPSTELSPQIIVFSDGTDAVSTQFEEQDLPTRGAELGIPIHTVVLDNENLENDLKQEGRLYLSQVSEGTGGISTILGTGEELNQIYQQIAAFRDQQIFRYTIDELTGGDHQVEIGLAGSPGVSDQLSVNIPPGAPSITIDLPPESRQLVLQNLDAAVPLSFSTTLSWLDGVVREITKAQLVVNGLIIQDLDVNELENFDVEIANFIFGDNQVQIAIVDDQGSRATSPEIILAIEQGETQVIPEEVEPSGLFDRLWQRTRGLILGIGGCLVLIIAVLVIIGLYRVTRGSSIARSLGLTNMMYRIPFLRPFASKARKAEYYGRRAESSKRQMGRYSPEVRSTDRSKKGGEPAAYLEVLESMTQRSGRIDLTSVEMKLGRSAKQADIVFNKDATVSRIHASIVQEGNDFRIFDEQSTSGTFVNEQRVPEYGLQLVDNDEVRLGGVRLRFRNL